MSESFLDTIAQSSGWDRSEIAQSFSAAVALAVLVVVYIAVTRHLARKSSDRDYMRRDRAASDVKRLRDL